MVTQPIFVKPLDLGTITTGNAATGYPAANVNRHKALGLKWQSSGATNLWLRGDMGAVQDIDFCAVLSATALASTTFRLRLGDNQTEVDGTADYDSGAQTFIDPAITREDGLYHSFWRLPSTQTKRWWRLDFGSHSGDLSAAFVVLGKAIQPSRYYSDGFENGVEDLGEPSFTRLGVWDEKPGLIMRTKTFSLNWITRDEWEGEIGPMVEALGSSGPVYCCFDATEDVYRQRRTYFGRFQKSPYARAMRMPNTFGAEFQILSLI